MTALAVIAVALLAAVAFAVVAVDTDAATGDDTGITVEIAPGQTKTYTWEELFGPDATKNMGDYYDEIEAGVNNWHISVTVYNSKISTTAAASGVTIECASSADEGDYQIYLNVTDEADGLEFYRISTVRVVNAGTITIDSVGGTDATVGYRYSYTVQTTPSDATVTISGNASDWLSVSGHTVSGTPMTAGSYTLTITASKSGCISATETVVIVVAAAATSEGAPTISDLTYSVDPSDPYRITFSVTATDASSVEIDYGDGNSGTGATTTHTYTQSGSYTVTARATNSNGSVTKSVSVLIADSVPNSYVAYNGQYTFTLGIDTTGQSVSVTGCPFLTVTTGSNYVTVSGSPTSTAYVGETYTVVLTVGTFSMSWQLTVDEGSTYPVAGFTYEMSGRTVTITSTASNADTVYYDFGDGHTVLDNSKTVTYTYDDDGDYVITQTVYATVGGQTYEDSYTAMVTAHGTAEDDDGSTMATIAAVCVILGLIVLVAGLWTRNVWIAAIGVALVVAGAALYLL